MSWQEKPSSPSSATSPPTPNCATPRHFDKTTGQWTDGEALFQRCRVWQRPAENVAETLTKGMRVIVQGRLRQRSFQTQENDKRTVVELEVDEIGPALRYATATVTKTKRGNQPTDTANQAETTTPAEPTDEEVPF